MNSQFIAVYHIRTFDEEELLKFYSTVINGANLLDLNIQHEWQQVAMHITPEINLSLLCTFALKDIEMSGLILEQSLEKIKTINDFKQLTLDKKISFCIIYACNMLLLYEYKKAILQIPDLTLLIE